MRWTLRVIRSGRGDKGAGDNLHERMYEAMKDTQQREVEISLQMICQ